MIFLFGKCPSTNLPQVLYQWLWSSVFWGYGKSFCDRTLGSNLWLSHWCSLSMSDSWGRSSKFEWVVFLYTSWTSWIIDSIDLGALVVSALIFFQFPWKKGWWYLFWEGVLGTTMLVTSKSWDVYIYIYDPYKLWFYIYIPSLIIVFPHKNCHKMGYKTIVFWTKQFRATGPGWSSIYPLVNIQKTMENHHV